MQNIKPMATILIEAQHLLGKHKEEEARMHMAEAGNTWKLIKDEFEKLDKAINNSKNAPDFPPAVFKSFLVLKQLITNPPQA